MTKDLFDKYIWLVDIIYRSGKITFEEINERWLRSKLSDGMDIPLRTFHNWRAAIEQIFDININCNRKGGYYYYIENVEDIDAIPKDRRYRVIVQTTFESEKYSMLLKELDERGYSYIVSNSICMASEKRSEAVRAFKGKVDLLIVIGDKKSANSNALVAEAKGVGLEAFLCEDAYDLDIERLKGVSSVAISAGSSTPDNIIEEVVRRIEEL